MKTRQHIKQRTIRPRVEFQIQIGVGVVVLKALETYENKA